MRSPPSKYDFYVFYFFRLQLTMSTETTESETGFAVCLSQKENQTSATKGFTLLL